jgi:hypothetical protein
VPREVRPGAAVLDDTLAFEFQLALNDFAQWCRAFCDQDDDPEVQAEFLHRRQFIMDCGLAYAAAIRSHAQHIDFPLSYECLEEDV